MLTGGTIQRGGTEGEGGTEKRQPMERQLEKEEHRKELEMSLTLRGDRQFSLGRQRERRGCWGAASPGHLSPLGKSLRTQSKEESIHH